MDFAAPWPIAAVIVMLIGVRWAIAQESIDFQDRNKVIDAGVLSVINTEQTARGLGAVSGNEVLQTAAQWMAEDMAARHVLDHTDSRHRGFPIGYKISVMRILASLPRTLLRVRRRRPLW